MVCDCVVLNLHWQCFLLSVFTMGQFITAYDQFFIDDGRQYEYSMEQNHNNSMILHQHPNLSSIRMAQYLVKTEPYSILTRSKEICS